MGWRYIASRLHGDGTETFLDWNLPLSAVGITNTLSGPDAITASIGPEVAALKVNGLPLIQPWSTAIYAEHDGQIQCGAIVTDTKVDGPLLTLACVGFSGYAKDMPYTGEYSGVQVDPLVVVRHIWTHIQSAPGGDLWLQVDPLLTGLQIGDVAENVDFTTSDGEVVSFVAGPVKFAWYQTTDLGGEIDTLAKETPFDYREEHVWNGSPESDGSFKIAHHLRLGYPAIGSRRDDLRFVVGENVQIVPTVAFGVDYASEVLAIGAGEGNKMIRSTSGISGHPTNGRLRRVAVVSDKSILTTASANKLAAIEVLGRSGLAGVTEVIVSDHPHAHLGSFGVGDEILVQTGPGWADDLALWCRITSITVSPDALGVARLTLQGEGRGIAAATDRVAAKIVRLQESVHALSTAPQIANSEVVADINTAVVVAKVVNDAELATIRTTVVAAQAAGDNAQTVADSATFAANHITTTQITDGAITTPKILVGNITAALIAAGAITVGKIDVNAVEASNIAAGAVVAGKLSALAVVAGDIEVNAVTAGTIAAGAVTVGTIAAGAVTADTIEANAINGMTISGNTITGGDITGGTITGGTITGEDITGGTITGTTISGGDITGTTISGGDITGTTISGGTITGGDISGGTISGGDINGGTITGGDISGGTVSATDVSNSTITASTFSTAGGSGSRVEIGISGGYPTDQMRMYNGGTISSIRNPDGRPGSIQLDSYDGVYGSIFILGPAPSMDGHHFIQFGLSGLKSLNSAAIIQARDRDDTVYGTLVAGAFAPPSALVLKDNVTPLTVDALSLVANNGLHAWNWKAKPTTGGVGLIADYMPDWIRVEDGYDLVGAVAILWEAIKQLDARQPKESTMLMPITYKGKHCE